MTKALIWCCVIVVAFVLVVPAALLCPIPAVRAQDLPPRPTRQPTTQPTTQPSAEPTVAPPVQPTARPRRRSKDDDTPQHGRITGTVIDAASGQPLVGVGVLVGHAIVLSDANGNYTLADLKAGTYQVALAPAQGTLINGPLQVQLARDATVIQHLVIRRLEPRAAPRGAT